MSRNKTLFIYNGLKTGTQEWTIYSEGVINQDVTIGPMRKSFTITVKGDTSIQFGVDRTVYLKADYNYGKDAWVSHTSTPNEIHFIESGSTITVSSTYEPAKTPPHSPHS